MVPPISRKLLTDFLISKVNDAFFEVEKINFTHSFPVKIVVVLDKLGGLRTADIVKLTELVKEFLGINYPDLDYDLEVTTPGIDRPLTTPAHWCRAQGRKVKYYLNTDSNNKPLEKIARIGAVQFLDPIGVELISNKSGKFFKELVLLSQINFAQVQPEFNQPNKIERKLTGEFPEYKPICLF